MNYIDHLKEEWRKSGLDPELMLETMKMQWKAAGMDPDMMLQQLSNMPFNQEMMQQISDEAIEELEDDSDEDVENPFTAWEDDNLKYSSSNGADIDLLKAISCGALLSVINESTLNTLRSGHTLDDVKYILTEFWSINDASSLKETINWLLHFGHRSGFNLVTRCLAAYQPDQWEAHSLEILQNIEDSSNADADYTDNFENALEIIPYVKQFLDIDLTKFQSTIAWDYCRAIHLYRWGLDAGFCSENEASTEIKRIAAELYKKCGSWEQLSVSYILGHLLWSGNVSEVNDVLHAHYLLTTDSKSPWQLIDWK
ncbi:MAG: DUF1266 domain-containing protein [Bacteroidales bacterium]|nr:DUF1266 domain-containing protein [Bacteroidales bacterium]